MDEKINFLDNPLCQYPYNKPKNLEKKVILTETENKIFEIIKKTLEKNNLKTICRVAGGWVRDKLLNKNSIDIDIALDNMKGYDLAKLINKDLYPDKDKVGLINQNSEKGKHLETATIPIHHIWIDFVNLRSDNDNIFGSAKEDSERRDLSINSLFYNINSNEIEDYNNGFKDLENGIIQTPIQPYLTFKDDPLRILRMIRFAIKYQFLIHDDINSCILKYNDEYKNAFINSISNERVQKELSYILKLKYSNAGIYLIYKYNLIDAVLKLESYNNKELNDNLKNEIIKTINVFLVGYYIAQENNFCENDEYNKDDNFRLTFHLLLLTVSFRNFKVKTGKEIHSVSQLILKDTLKYSSDQIKENLIMTSSIDEFMKIVNDGNYNRLNSGKILRNIQYKNIPKLFITSIALEYFEKRNLNEIIIEVNKNILGEIFIKYNKFNEYIKKENLLHLDELKPLLNGKEIIKELQIKPGKEIGVLLQSLLDKQIESPDFTRDCAIDFLNKKREEIKDSFTESTKKEKKKKK